VGKPVRVDPNLWTGRDRRVSDKKQPNQLSAGKQQSFPGSFFGSNVMRQDQAEYVGAIHAHSTYSDGGGSVDEILSAATNIGIDFLILTDHNTLEAREAGYEGWHDDLLLIVGDEVSSRHGHCLALGTDSHVNHRQKASGVLADITSQGGNAYIAHPHGRYRPLLRLRDHSWKAWDAGAFTGIELWSYMFDWASTFHYSRFLNHYKDPDAQIRGPSPETVSKWDELCQQRRVVALGGVDAHARKYPLLPLVVFPYRQQFKTVRTHILCSSELSASSESDIKTVLKTISEGSCFLSFDGLADGTGTRFGSADGDLTIGEESIYQGETDLVVSLPREAEISTIKDGYVTGTATASEHTFHVEGPGVYRVEARLNQRPWIFTNPIYLRHS
jgi:hypothetical protein